VTINNRRIRVNEVELNIVTQGEGPVVLFVHGFPDDHTVWRNHFPALVDAGYHVIALDTRGCGFLTEDQMSGSERYCDAGFRYFRIDGANHWLQLTASEKLNPLLLQWLH
jgi:alpha-beta hydrolase superfamily lysophospholipase